MENLLTVKQSGVTVFVGDGINDGPVLAAADLGIAMGMGSDLATQTADMVLMSNNLKGITAAIRACRKGMRIARGNIVFILLVKALVLVLGALGLSLIHICQALPCGRRYFAGGQPATTPEGQRAFRENPLFLSVEKGRR